MSRREFLQRLGAGGLALLAPSVATPASSSVGTANRQLGNVVLRWNNALLQGVRESRLGPPMVSRALAVAHTCMFDAWAAYDRPAVGTRFGGALGRPAQAVTLAWDTGSDAADQAGISRRYGGIHFERGDLDARATGRLAARAAWAEAQTYFNGSAS